MPVSQAQKLCYATFVTKSLFESFKPDPAKVPTTLWYYTSGATLIAMMQSQSLWATQVSCLNDESEYRYLFDLLFDKVNASTSTDNNLSVLHQHIEKAKARERQSNSYWFVCSFCKERDDLNLWRGYAGGEGGCAIAFDVQKLFRRWWLLPVLYCKQKQNDLVVTLVDKMDKFFVDGLSKDQTSESWAEEFFAAWEDQISAIAPLMKHPKFRAENEWRFLHTLEAPEQRNLKYQQRGTAITRHLPLCFQAWVDSLPRLVTEIMVGPSRHKQMSKSSIENLLQSCGYGDAIKVTLSEIPFRSLA